MCQWLHIFSTCLHNTGFGAPESKSLHSSRCDMHTSHKPLAKHTHVTFLIHNLDMSPPALPHYSVVFTQSRQPCLGSTNRLSQAPTGQIFTTASGLLCGIVCRSVEHTVGTHSAGVCHEDYQPGIHWWHGEGRWFITKVLHRSISRGLHP